MSVEERMRRFIDAGYRPNIRSHGMSWSQDKEDAGWATLWTTGYGYDEPTRRSVGWVVDAKDVSGKGRQHIIGGTFPSIDEALTYAERELEKYAA